MRSGSSKMCGNDVLRLWYIKNPNTMKTATPNIGNTEYNNVCIVLFFVAVVGLTVDSVLGPVAVMR